MRHQYFKTEFTKLNKVGSWKYQNKTTNCMQKTKRYLPGTGGRISTSQHCSQMGVPTPAGKSYSFTRETILLTWDLFFSFLAGKEDRTQKNNWTAEDSPEPQMSSGVSGDRAPGNRQSRFWKAKHGFRKGRGLNRGVRKMAARVNLEGNLARLTPSKTKGR